MSFCSSYEAEQGTAFAHRFFEKPVTVTALVLGNDALALGFMRAAHQRGLRIPEELSVTGFDGIPEAARFWPGLTTVVQPMREMGREACRRLFEAMSASAQRTTVEYPMSLIARESSGPPRRSKSTVVTAR